MDKETLRYFKDTRPWRVNSGMIETSGGVPIAHMDRDTPNTSPTERDANAHFIVEAVNAYTITKDEPVTYFFLTMAGDSIVVQYEDSNGVECSYTFKDIFDYHHFITLRRKEANVQGLSIRVMASSSLDFPHEYSQKQGVVDLARAIRASEVPV